MPEVLIQPHRQVSIGEVSLLSEKTAEFMVTNKLKVDGIQMPDFLPWLNTNMSSIFFAEMKASSWDHVERDGQTWIVICSNDIDIDTIHEAVKSKIVF